MKGRSYSRLTKAERASLERGLDRRMGCREIAAAMGRSATTVSDEVRRNRTVASKAGGKRGRRASECPPPGGVEPCPRLAAWPWTCNGCPSRRTGCQHAWRCEYDAQRAQRLADALAADARRGVNMDEAAFLAAMEAIRSDLARGMSPEQICAARPEVPVSPSTVYRWVGRGYGGMCDMDLRAKVGYKPRRRREPRPTAHGPERSHASFLALGEEVCASACEMDTVIGLKRDSQCVLTLYPRPCKFQALLLLPDKAPGAVAAALGSLERSLGRRDFKRIFGLILTDNGIEFAATEMLEGTLHGNAPRCKVYYCDVRASQQKGACEKNHVELRKILPKRRGISFDRLEQADLAAAMSHLNSSPRPSLGGLSPIEMLLAVYKSAGGRLLEALGVEQLPYAEVKMTPDAVNDARRARGREPLV